MGLESVELVMEIEERFGISMSDADAALISTVGDLQRFIVAACEETEQQVTPDEAWTWLRDFLEHRYRIPRDKITLDARIGPDLGLD